MNNDDLSHVRSHQLLVRKRAGKSIVEVDPQFNGKMLIGSNEAHHEARIETAGQIIDEINKRARAEPQQVGTFRGSLSGTGGPLSSLNQDQDQDIMIQNNLHKDYEDNFDTGLESTSPKTLNKHNS